jgi:hypothetical protein
MMAATAQLRFVCVLVAAMCVDTADVVFAQSDASRRVVGSGTTTVIVSAGSSLAVENHVQVARYVAQRVADELMNAQALPIAAGWPKTVRDVRDEVERAIVTTQFRYVVIVGDESTRVGDTSLERIAATLDAEWQSKGARVFYVAGHEIRPGQDMTLNADYLRRWASRTVPAARRKPVEDFSELLFVDRDRQWLRDDMIAAQDRAVVSKELGKMLVEQRVSAILTRIRELSPSHVR